MIRKPTIAITVGLLMTSLIGIGIAHPTYLSSPNTDGTSSAYAYPERPSPLNASNVGSYAKDYEEAYIYELVSGNGERSVETFEFACEPSVAEIQSTDGFLVMLECEYLYEDEMDEEPYRAGGTRSYAVGYQIDGETTTRDDPDTTSDTIGASGGQTTKTVHYLDHPDRPASLNETTVVAYAIAYEKAIKHNEVLTSHSSDTLTEIEIHCSNTSVEKNDDEFTVDLYCGYSYTTETGDCVAIADGVPYTVTYRINAMTTERDLD